MNPNEFIKIIRKSIETGQTDEKVLSHEARFFRGKYILKTMENVSNLLKIFDFPDKIIFQDSIAYILLNEIMFRLDNSLFLKHTGKKLLLQCQNTINFINYIKLNPRIIIDVGACWGEYSLFLAKEFPKSKIFSIEGSPINFESFKHNININYKISKIVYPFNLIISDLDGNGAITNNLNTMNVVRDMNESEVGVVKVKSKKLETFISDQGIKHIDFIKIDIEGSELKLLNSLTSNFFKVIQIELINYNDIQNNIDFVIVLSEFYNFYDTETFKKLTVSKLKKVVTSTLMMNPTIDLFLINKRLKIH